MFSSAKQHLLSPAAPLPQILFEETLFQNASDGTPFVKMLQDKGIIPGIKVGRGDWLSSLPWAGGGCFSVSCGQEGLASQPPVGRGACCPAAWTAPVLPPLWVCKWGWGRGSPGIRINVGQARCETCNASTLLQIANASLLAGPPDPHRWRVWVCTAAHSPSTPLHIHLSCFHAPTPPSPTQVDKGVVALPGTDGETETQGIDDLGKR